MPIAWVSTLTRRLDRVQEYPGIVAPFHTVVSTLTRRLDRVQVPVSEAGHASVDVSTLTRRLDRVQAGQMPEVDVLSYKFQPSPGG